MNRVIHAILKWSLIICSLQVSVISLKLRICTASNIREVRISQLLIDLLPVLKRFLSQTINGPECETARTAERYERWYRWEWAIQRYHNFGVNIFRKMQCREQLMTEIRQTAPGGNRWPSMSIGILLPNPVGRAHMMWWGSSSSKALSKMSIWSFVVEKC